MIITNKAPRLIHLPRPKTEEDNTHPQSKRGATQMLVPGKNEIPDAYWDAVKDHPQVQKLVDRGTVVPGVSPVPETPKAPIATPVEPAEEDEARTVSGGSGDLDELSAPDAVEIVKNEDNLERLQQWLLGEERKSVKTAITKRIEKLKNPE